MAGWPAADHGRRIGSLEELFRSNEMTVANLLSRLRDLEVNLAQGTKQREGQLASALAATQRDVAGARQRLDAAEQQWRGKVQELDDKLTMLRQTAAHSTDAQAARLGSEVAQLKHTLGDVAAEVRRVGSAVHQQAAHGDRSQQEATVLMGGVKQQFQQQRDELLANQRQIEGALKLIGDEGREREGLAASVRAAFESSLRAFGDQTVAMLEKEVSQRLQLAQDVVGAFQRLRDELAAAFSKHGEGQERHASALRSVEDILRAEIRSRMQRTDEIAQHLKRVDERGASDARTLAQALRDLDSETTTALEDLRQGFASEYKVSLEQVARRVAELQQSLVAAHAGLRQAEQATSDIGKEVGKMAAEVPVRVAASVGELRSEVADAQQATRAEVERLIAEELRRVRSQSTQRLDEHAEQVHDLRARMGGDMAQRLDEVRRTAKEDSARQGRSLEDMQLSIKREMDAAGAETRRAAAELKAGIEEERRQWQAAAEQLRAEVADERAERRRMQEELAKLVSGHQTGHIRAPSPPPAPGSPRPVVGAAGFASERAVRDVEDELRRVRQEVAAEVADTRELAGRLRSLESRMRGVDEHIRQAVPPPEQGEGGSGAELRLLKRRVDETEQLVREASRDAQRRHQQDFGRVQDEMAELRRLQRQLADEARHATAHAPPPPPQPQPPRPVASALQQPPPAVHAPTDPRAVQRATELSEAAAQTALRAEAATQEEREERLELRKLFEGQVHDCRIALEFLEKSVRELQQAQGGAAAAAGATTARGFDPAPWAALRDVEASLAAERKARGDEDRRLNALIKTLEELAQALHDDIGDSARQTERDLRRWVAAYVEEKMIEVRARSYAGGGDDV
eukprot:TRINITY_DN4104_c0_g2_i2.p1 TRINITY_DN4104_c0_g2~~TRINITY_DN4104_c0_g2_i2.p1  ORF type:complete len:878 (+),score=332.88 TRINITY_DN4104_c0_g2_i2:56-2635(+)